MEQFLLRDATMWAEEQGVMGIQVESCCAQSLQAERKRDERKLRTLENKVTLWVSLQRLYESGSSLMMALARIVLVA